jgi:Zn finger protein HypA/HybF involved in hydrogenase expression
MFQLWKSAISLALLLMISSVMAQLKSERVSPYTEENQECLKCHGQRYFSYYNDWVEKDVKERMNPFHIIDSAEFYMSNHWNFRCTDCHSSEYASSFPHPNELRFEPKYTCMDCHEGDDNYAHFQFETIQEEFLASVHSEKHSDEFTCWMCHNPHSYHISARPGESLSQTISYDNAICLSCHSDEDRMGLLSDRVIFNMLDQHEWLPNHLAHFKSVRCIECHAEFNDNILVAHKILPKEQAVKKCVECHSQNSLLMASLYKYQVKEKREKQGFINAAILTETYVIGANRNKFLNIASVVIFGMTILGIGIHAIMRKIHSKN